jgi:hypothetical protein
MIDINTYITINTGSLYHDACLRAGLTTSDKHLVIGFEEWLKWYNEQRFSDSFITPPTPVFKGDTYEIAKQVADELNESAEELHAKKG